MGFGQYSAGGGIDRRKPEMLAIAERHAGSPIVWSRIGGKNRLHFKCEDGSQGFTLHETVVASIDAKGVLTLADGGWHTLTTKSAWNDALAAFGLCSRHFVAYGMQDTIAAEVARNKADGLPSFYSSHEGVYGYWSEATNIDAMPAKDERSVRYTKAENGRWTRDAVQDDLPMIRASVEDGNFAVRFTGSEIVSEAGARHRCTPFKVLTLLLRIDALARETHGMVTFRDDALYRFSFEALGYTINPGHSPKVMMVGCHTFKTVDFRAMLRKIGGMHPDALKAAKCFVRKHPTDFGVKAWKAERAARYARTAA